MIINSGIKLYHGSYTPVDKPDLSLCADGKDFGKGFYLTTDIDQATRFVRSSVKKAEKNGIKTDASRGYVSVYSLDSVEKIKVYKFSDANKDWLHCVAAHRKSTVFPDELEIWSKYDLIAGKIANDNTNQVITAYINGLYGPVGSEIADDTAIRLLIPNKLTDQLCFRTKKALNELKYLECIEIPIAE